MIMMKRFLSYFGVSGANLDWFFSYLDGRSQSFVVNALPSDSVTLILGVSHSSVLGPFFYFAHANPLSLALKRTNLNSGDLEVVKMGQISDDTHLRIGFRLLSALSSYWH